MYLDILYFLNNPTTLNQFWISIMNDLSDLLMKYKVDNDKAQYVKNRISGSDLMTLISLLNRGDAKSLNQANIILKNFGVEIMEQKFNSIIKSSKNLNKVLSENCIEFKKRNDVYIMSINEAQKNKLRANLKENTMKKYDKRLMELAGLAGLIPSTDIDVDTDSVVTDDDVITNFDGDDVISTTVVTDEIPPTSEAFNQIQDFFNSIQNLIPDVRVSEYKALCGLAANTSNRIQSLGGTFLN